MNDERGTMNERTRLVAVSDRLFGRLSSFKFQVSSFLALVLIAWSQPINVATNYEWELAVPGRTLFRDRTPVGEVSFVKEGARTGIIGKKVKYTGENLGIVADVAFVPGDTVRYFGVALELASGSDLIRSTFMDGDELPQLWSSLKYMLETGDKIRGTEREDTRMQFRGKSGWTLTYFQNGTMQRVELSFPAIEKQYELVRTMTRDELSTFKDLVDLTMFELKRQGAQFAPVSSK